MLKKFPELLDELQAEPVEGIDALDAYLIPGKQQLTATVCRYKGDLSLAFSTPSNPAAIVVTLSDLLALAEAAKKFATLTGGNHG